MEDTAKSFAYLMENFHNSRSLLMNDDDLIVFDTSSLDRVSGT